MKNNGVCWFTQTISKMVLCGVSLALFSQQVAMADEEKVLNVYNWSDYIAEDTIKNFEKETGIKVRYDVFDTNEILHAKLVTRKSGYDIVVPSDTFAQLQLQGGLLKKLDKSQLPNLANLDPVVQTALAKLDPGNDYLVTWLWGYTTVGINTKKVKDALGELPMPTNAWELLFNPKYAQKISKCGISVMDSGNEVIPASLIYIGKKSHSPNPLDYKEAGEMLKKIRPYVSVFSSSSYINDLANGGLCAVMGYSGDINIARHRAVQSKNGNDIQALIPATSAVLFFDTMAIPIDAPHPNNALRWMNYIMRPEVHASLTNKVFYANPNLAGFKFVKKEIFNNKTVFLTEEDKKRMTPPEVVDAKLRRVISRTFTEFKTGL